MYLIDTSTDEKNSNDLNYVSADNDPKIFTFKEIPSISSSFLHFRR